MHKPTDSNFQVKVTHDYKAPAERVFNAWVDPEAVRKWWSLIETASGTLDIRRVEIDARLGGRYTFSDMRREGEAVHWGTYKVFDPGKKLAFTFFTSDEDEKEDNSTVTMDFFPTAEGCRVELTHEMDAKWMEYATQTSNGWSQMLKSIDRFLG